MKKLKPYPFCGNKAMMIKMRYHDELPFVYSVECANSICSCKPSTLDYETEEEAIEAWNRRAPK